MKLAALLRLAGLAMVLSVTMTCALAAEDIVLGQVLSLSGTQGAVGREIHAGTQACVDHLNRGGGVAGRRLRLLVRDDAGDPARAQAEAQALTEAGAGILLGPLGAEAARAVLPWAASAGIAVLGPHTREVGVRQGGFQTSFFLTANTSLEAEKLAEHLLTLGVRRVAVLLEPGGPGADALLAFQEALSVAGIQVVAMSAVRPHAAGEAVRAALDQSPQAIVLTTSAAATRAALRALVQQRSTRGLYGVYGLSFSALPDDLRDLGNLAAGLVQSQVLPAVSDGRQRLSTFYQAALRAAPSASPSALGLEGCLAPLMLSEAVRGRAMGDAGKSVLLNALRSAGKVSLGAIEVTFSPQGAAGGRYVDIQSIGSDGRVVR